MSGDPQGVLRRLETLDPLFGALATSLDIRDVFQQVAAVARCAVPHDFLSLALFGDEGWTIKLHALSEGVVGGLDRNRLTPAVRALMARDFVLVGDVADHPDGEMLRI